MAGAPAAAAAAARKVSTLVLLVRDGRALLGMKKRGFGAGKWNGFGGKVEPGTDHARAPGVSGSVFELACDPFCLFNLTADLGERQDLAQDPAYKEIAANLTERLAYHAATGPPPAYLWPDADDWKTKGVEPLCAASETSGHVEPLDVSAESRS